MQSDKRQIAESVLVKGGKHVVVWAALIVCLIVLMASSLQAKYVTSSQVQAEIQSSRFHISSNYLVECAEGLDPVSHVVPNAGEFDIFLYNYETENTALVSEIDITYTVSAENADVIVQSTDGTPVPAGADNSYQLKKTNGTDALEQVTHVLHVKPNTSISPNNPVTVTVQTTSPYRKRLAASFEIASSMPNYTIADQRDGTVLVTVATNDFAGDVTLNWNTQKFSPDNTNVMMSTWTDVSSIGATTSSSQGSFAVERNSTYKLLFFKNITAEYMDTTGTDAVITLE